MPNIKLPYTEEGMDLADQIQDRVDAVGGDISSEYPTSNAADRMTNTPMDTGIGQSILPDVGQVPDMDNPDILGNYDEGGQVDDSLEHYPRPKFRERSNVPLYQQHEKGGKVPKYQEGGEVKDKQKNIVKKATVTLKADGKVVKEVKIPYKIKSDLKGGALDQAVAPIAAELRKTYGRITAGVKSWGKQIKSNIKRDIKTLKETTKATKEGIKEAGQRIKKVATSPKEDKDLEYESTQQDEGSRVVKKKKK